MFDHLLDFETSALIQAQIAALPRRAGAQRLPYRVHEDSTTFHYSGVVHRKKYNRSRTSELALIVAEARDHLQRNWGKAGAPPVYADCYMYDFVVLSDGTLIRANAQPRHYWHTGNSMANATSWSVHVLLQPGEDLTISQHETLVALFDALALPVYGHCEWPRGEGNAQPSTSFRRLFGQSICPGPLLHQHLVAYRARRPSVLYTPDSPLLGQGRASVATMVSYLADTHYDAESRKLIVQTYVERCRQLGLNHDLAIAQVAHETGRLTSWWCARPRRNPAGLGVTGDTSRNLSDIDPRYWAIDGEGARHGMSFTAWRDDDAPDGHGSISHHLGRLLAYALPAGQGTKLQQAFIIRALALRGLPSAYRGAAPTLAGLNGRWAYPGLSYATGIVRHANALLRSYMP